MQKMHAQILLRVPRLLRRDYFVWSQRESDNVVFLSTEVLDFYRTKWQQFKHCPKKETSDSCLIDPFCVTIWSSSLIKRLKKSKTRSPYFIFFLFFRGESINTELSGVVNLSIEQKEEQINSEREKKNLSKTNPNETKALFTVIIFPKEGGE